MKFGAIVFASPDLMEQDREIADDLCRRNLERHFSDLRGPRGGRYERVGDITLKGPVDAWDALLDPYYLDHRSYVYTATCMARYVRPSRDR